MHDPRRRTALVRYFRTMSGVTNSELAKCLKISEAYFNNKMHRNSFSVEDLTQIANYCGYEICAVNRRDRSGDTLYLRTWLLDWWVSPEVPNGQ